MSWTYSDYITYTDPTARLARLRLHIQEVSDQIGREISGDGKSKSENNITQYLADLRREEKELAEVPGTGTGYNGGVSLSRARRAR